MFKARLVLAVWVLAWGARIACGQEAAGCKLLVRAELACVRPGTVQRFTMTFSNGTPATVEARIRLVVEHGLNGKIDLNPCNLKAPPGGTAEAIQAWKPEREYWGCHIVAETQIGERSFTALDVFAVSTDVFAASPVCQTILGLNINNAHTRLRQNVENVKRAGGLILEHFNWQASTWGPVYPRKEVWRAGMSPSGRTDRKSLIHYVAKLVHERGMKFTTYASPVFAGPEGCKWARAHPEAVKYPTPDGKLPMQEKLASVAAANTLHRPTLDQGIDEYIKCIREFGYDGIRWDGHPGVFYHPHRDAMHRFNRSTALPGFDDKGNLLLTDDVDATNVEIWRYVRKRFQKECPGVRFGFNMGLGFYHEKGFNVLFPRAFAETARGSMVIDEKQMNAGSGDGVPSQVQNRTWERARKSMLMSSDLIRTVGGTAYRGPVYAGCEPFARHCYSLFFAGATHVWGAGGLPREWGRFALRFGKFLFHPSLVRAGNSLKVTREKAAKNQGESLKLWHEEFNYDLFTDARMHRIVHLLNPPVSKIVNVKTTKAPPRRIENVRIVFRVPRGLKPEAARFFVLSPEWSRPCRPADAKVSGEWATVSVPSFHYWAFAVMEVPVNTKTLQFPKQVENWFLEIEKNPQQPVRR